MDHEHAEWRDSVRSMSETELIATEVELRMAAGMCGDKEDALYD